MKKTIVIIAGLLLMLPSVVSAAAFGPEKWTQYRMDGDKNAVFDTDSKPLKAQTFKTANEVRSTPVIVGNKLFIGNHMSGDLFAFDLETGKQLWHNKAPNWIHSEMIVADDTVFVGYGNRFFQESDIRGTEESGVLALDPDTGKIRWKFATKGEVMPTPAYYKDAVYATTGDKHLYKLDPKTGELLHKEDLGSLVSMSSPNITDDTLYVGGGKPEPYAFTAYDLENEEIRWQQEFPDVYSGMDDVPPAVADNIVVTTGLEKASDGENPEHFIYAMNTDDGKILWKESLGAGEMVKNNKSGAPMIYNGNIYVGSPITKTFYAYDLKSGKLQWKFENEIMKAPPVAKDGIVYFTNTKGFVYAMDAEDGKQLGKKELGGTLAPAGPVIVNDTLFSSSQDSNVYALPLTAIAGQETLQTYQEKGDSSGNKWNMYALIIGTVLIVVAIILSRRLKKGRHS